MKGSWKEQIARFTLSVLITTIGLGLIYTFVSRVELLPAILILVLGGVAWGIQND